MTRKRIRKPTHPGYMFHHDVLESLGLSLTEAAQKLGVSRKHLSGFVNGHTRCNLDMAQRLALATNTSVDSFTVSMFHLAATNGFPVSLVGGLVSILEFSKTKSGDFLLNGWCFLDRRGRNDIFGLSSFFHLKLN